MIDLGDVASMTECMPTRPCLRPAKWLYEGLYELTERHQDIKACLQRTLSLNKD